VPALLKTAMLLDIGTLYTQRERLAAGNLVIEVPGTTRDIYRSYKSHPSDKGMR
jgi:hypothetical protein